MRTCVTLSVMCLLLGVSLAGVGAAGEGSGGKPEVYNHVTGASSEMDRVVHATYESRWRVIDISERDGTYTPPRVKDARAPLPVFDVKGDAVRGKVLAFFIIGPDGRVQDPVIIQASDPRLGPPVLATLANWTFVPARFKGEAVAATGGEEFNFPR